VAWGQKNFCVDVVRNLGTNNVFFVEQTKQGWTEAMQLMKEGKCSIFPSFRYYCLRGSAMQYDIISNASNSNHRRHFSFQGPSGNSTFLANSRTATMVPGP
jgi:hypothetical protein